MAIERVDVSVAYTIDTTSFIIIVAPKLDLFFSYSDRPNLSLNGRAQLAGFASYFEFVVQYAIFKKIKSGVFS